MHLYALILCLIFALCNSRVRVFSLGRVCDIFTLFHSLLFILCLFESVPSFDFPSSRGRDQSFPFGIKDIHSYKNWCEHFQKSLLDTFSSIVIRCYCYKCNLLLSDYFCKSMLFTSISKSHRSRQVKRQLLAILFLYKKKCVFIFRASKIPTN